MKKITDKDQIKSQKRQEEIQDLENKWKRALADYQNLEKRIQGEKEDFVRFANALLIEKLLSALDHLEKAEEHLKDQGLTVALQQLRSVLKSAGVEEIKALGEQFNPEKMECGERVEGEENKVIEIINKGYYLNQKVLRPAKVKVGQKKQN